MAANGLLCALGALASRHAVAAVGKQTVSAPSPYGPIAPVRDSSTGLPLLALPEGFEYRSYGWSGDTMTDGRHRMATDQCTEGAKQAVGRHDAR